MTGAARRGWRRGGGTLRPGGGSGLGGRGPRPPRECLRPGDGRLGPFPTPTPRDAVGGKFLLWLFNLIYKIFFLENHLVWRLKDLVLKKEEKEKAAAADAAGPECV